MAWPVAARHGSLGRGTARYGWLGGLWHGRLLYGLFRLGWRGRDRLVLAVFGSGRQERLGSVR